jgi:hypothetical protein
VTIHKENSLSGEVNILRKVETTSVEEKLVVNDISTGKIIFNTGIKKTGFLNRTEALSHYNSYRSPDRQRRMGNLERVEVVDVPLSRVLASERYVTIEVLVFKEDIGKIRYSEIPKDKEDEWWRDFAVGKFRFSMNEFYSRISCVPNAGEIDEYGYVQIWPLWGRGERVEPFPFSRYDYSFSMIYRDGRCETISYPVGDKVVYNTNDWRIPHSFDYRATIAEDTHIFLKSFYVVVITYDLKRNKRYVECLTDYHYDYDYDISARMNSVRMKALIELPSDYIPTPKKIYSDEPQDEDAKKGNSEKR